MTAPAPRDQLRADLVGKAMEGLPHSAGCVAHGGECLCARVRLRHAVRVVDAMLPIVERREAEAAARALEAAYVEDRTTVAKLSPIERLTCFLVKSEDLVTRAADLRAQAGERQ